MGKEDTGLHQRHWWTPSVSWSQGKMYRSAPLSQGEGEDTRGPVRSGISPLPPCDLSRPLVLFNKSLSAHLTVIDTYSSQVPGGFARLWVSLGPLHQR